uniref:Putative secreted protein n=1 Tax=Anopheles triannulatus TaxID=58253 RepID=A0A2M4B5J2_9DIPT
MTIVALLVGWVGVCSSHLELDPHPGPFLFCCCCLSVIEETSRRVREISLAHLLSLDNGWWWRPTPHTYTYAHTYIRA